ncbi:hypothetical protein P8X24_05920 [Pyrococcus kukulkanii]|uniref:hypothetical protein n=1 Tax=Pyrococcus kukulkanii TaxID=1609559 RepID=UPI00356A8C24
MWVDVLTYPSTSPPKFPKFRRATFRLDGKKLIFNLRPMGELAFNLDDIEDVCGVVLTLFKPPRRGIKLTLSWGQEVIVSVGRNPLIYDKRGIYKLLRLIFSPLIEGTVVEVNGKVGILKIIDNQVALVTQGNVIPVKPNEIKGEVGEKVRKFLTLLKFLSKEEKEK